MPRPGSLCRAHAHDITLCIQHREYFFGDIYHDAMISTPYGEIAQTQWHAIPTRFPNVTAGEHVTMPNHVHGIIYIHPRESLVPAVGEPVIGTPARDAPTIPWTTFAPPPITGAGKTEILGNMVGTYKSLCVHGCLQWIKQNDPLQRLGTLWQRNYWEHIVRDEMELNRIREYIRNNPAKWKEDRFYGQETRDQIRETPAVYGEDDWMI